ncbi:MAG: hypothetical protein JSU01_22625 [Bacteroidetes bacterium]|nr:hypothetical protein [Bacteroidota bacterium]
MKRKLYITGVLFLLAIFVVVVLTEQVQVPPGDFKRTFLEKERWATQFISIPGHSCEKIINVSSRGIVITTNRPNELVAICEKQITSLLVNEPSFFNAPPGNFKELADSNAFYIFKLNSDSFLVVKPTKHSVVIHTCPPFAFTRCAMVDSNFFVFRKYNYRKRDQLFATLALPNGLGEETNLSAVNRDWGMSTDGALLYNNILKRFIYLYFYRPKAILFDSYLKLTDSLSLLGSDCRGISVIDISANTKDHFTTTKAPTVICNEHACTYQHYLLVHSGIRAKNERAGVFNGAEALDLYDLQSLKYLGSFRIPRYGAIKVRDIQLYNDTLYVLYQNRLGRFAMPYLKPG